MSLCDGESPIIQIHPTRRCNLRCLHCYSSSGPDHREMLGDDLLAAALDDAWDAGYRVASFSGGEPLMYDGLGRLLRHARALGMRTTVTTNGMLANGPRLEMLAGVTDVLAISLDGTPESHNRMRASDQAFDRMVDNLAGIRASGIPFGFIFTLTQFNVDEVDWAAQFAVSEGATLFQIHPLEQNGRAVSDLPGSRPDEIESSFAYIEAERLRRVHGKKLFVQLDVVHRELLNRHPGLFFTDQTVPDDVRLAQLVSPIIVEADGQVVPLTYGFSRRFALGSLHDRRFSDLARDWIATGYPAFRDLCRDAHAEGAAPTELPMLNWYELVSSRSRRDDLLAV